MEDFASVDAYLDASEQWPDEIRALRKVLLGTGLDEDIKWGKPCYSIDGGNVAIVQEFADHLALMFFKGVLLDDPAGVLQEQGPNTHAARRVPFTSVEEVTDLAEVVVDLVDHAMEVERNDVPLPPRPEPELVAELQERLEADPDLRAAFERLTPGRQREYHLHVGGAKQEATRRARVEKHVDRILAGKGLRDR